MKTDIIRVSSDELQIGNALQQVDKVAAYKGLSPKGAMHLRLLAEEMMGMMHSITGERDGEFWIEDNDGEYELHLRVKTWMSMEKRDQLIAASSSGKNEAARGLMGRLREFFDHGADVPALPLYYSEMPGEFTGSTLNWEWSMNAYQDSLRANVEQDSKAREMWDELEKSVVTHVADEIRVAVRGSTAEMTILKKIS